LPSAGRSRLRDALARGLGLALGLAALLGYSSVGAYYNGFRVPQGYGMNFLLPEELAHIALFSVLGLVAVVGLALALAGTSLVDRCIALGRIAVRHAGISCAVLTAAVFVSTLGISRYVLGHAAITDDEHVYRFIAQTLRTGSLTAPSPGTDLDFFREQFIVLTPQARYGKYPPGHPLLLAAGQALGLETLVVPLLTALLVPALYVVARRAFDRTTAVVAMLVFATSPQLLVTGATLFSQPAAALCLMAALACLLRPAGEAGPGYGGLLGAGAFLGYGVLVRPLPGVLFAFAAFGWRLTPGAGRAAARDRLRAAATMAAPMAVAAVVLLLVNHGQTGRWLSSGYQAFHAPGETGAGVGTGVGGDLALEVMSITASLLRLSVWLTGWPGSILFLLLARGGSDRGLLWSMIGAEWLYRLLSPKAGVGGAGPLYLFEVLPLLCLMVARGLLAAARSPRLARLAGPSPQAAAALLLAGAVVSLSMFLPTKGADLRRMADAQLRPGRLIRERGLTNAVVFHNGVAPPWTGLSWAYFPPCNSPALDDDVLWMRIDGRDRERNLEFARRRFPARSAWYYAIDRGKPVLEPLESFVPAPAARP
jgi:dolichyl-phosphate-mannose-protein mannosyltransferase